MWVVNLLGSLGTWINLFYFASKDGESRQNITLNGISGFFMSIYAFYFNLYPIVVQFILQTIYCFMLICQPDIKNTLLSKIKYQKEINPVYEDVHVHTESHIQEQNIKNEKLKTDETDIQEINIENEKIEIEETDIQESNIKNERLETEETDIQESNIKNEKLETNEYFDEKCTKCNKKECNC